MLRIFGIVGEKNPIMRLPFMVYLIPGKGERKKGPPINSIGVA